MASNVLVQKFDPIPYPNGESWDVPMSEEQFRKLHWSKKEARTRTALTRKVALLQHIAGSLSALVSERIVPEDRKRLREWEDDLRGLWSWSYVKLDNPSHSKNRELMRAFAKALEDIDDLKRGKQTKLREQVKDREAIIERQELRNAELLEELNELRSLVHSCPICHGKTTKRRTSR